MILGVAMLSLTLVSAFSAVDTGARTISASVVTDGTAYLGLAVYEASPNSGFASVDANGKIQVAFDDQNGDATGDGLNPDATYEFHSLVAVYNNGTQSVDLEVQIGGTDAASCEAALTSATDQSSATWATPTTSSLTVNKGSAAYLGLRLTAGSSTGSLSCDFTVASV